MKPTIGILWVLSIALAVGLTRLAGPDPEPEWSSSAATPSLEEAFSEFDPLRRMYLLSHALVDLRREDLPELKKMLDVRKMGVDAEQVKLIMIAWAKIDAPGAYEWAKQGPKNWRTTLKDAAMFAWAYHDGPGAVRVVEEIEDPELMAQARQSAMEGWLRSEDKNGVAEYIADYPNAKRRGRLFFLLAGEIVMREGMDAAMRWVEELPDEIPNNLKLGVFTHVAKMLATDDPLRAAEWYLEHRTEYFSEDALSGIALRWVQHHPERRAEAIEWLLAMSGDGIREGEREAAIAQGFRSWMQIDPDAAQPWLLEQLPNPALDPAITEALKRLLPTEPGRSMAWAKRLHDEPTRRRELIRVGARWRARDPESFDEWMKQSDLSEELLQKILETKPRGAVQRILQNLDSAAGEKP